MKSYIVHLENVSLLIKQIALKDLFALIGGEKHQSSINDKTCPLCEAESNLQFKFVADKTFSQYIEKIIKEIWLLRLMSINNTAASNVVQK